MVRLGAGTADVLAVVLVVSGVAAATVFGVVQLLTHGLRGVTAGKAMTRLRSVRLDDLGRPGFWRIVLRALVLWASAVTLVGPAVLFASGLWEPRGRSWLDLVAGCWLVDTRSGLDPRDPKALRHARRSLRARPDDLDERLPRLATGADGALLFPDARSRAGVVGGGTGARWVEDAAVASARTPAAPPTAEEAARGSEVPALVTQVPGALAAAPETDAPRALAPGPRRASFTAPPAPTDDDEYPPAAPPATDTIAVLPDPASPRRRAAWTLRLDDGQVLRVPRAGLLGRQPAPADGEEVDAVVALDDPERRMSKTHLGFGADEDGVWVIDRGSSNGTEIVRVDGQIATVVAGVTVRVAPGDTVRVGGRSFTVARRGEA